MPGTRKYQRPASIAAGCTSRGKIPRRFGKCGYGRQGKTPTAGVHHRSRRTVRPGRTDTQTTPDTSRAADGTTRTFSGLVQTVTAVQNGRGKLESALVFFCTQLAHELSRLSSDVCLYSAEEFGLTPEGIASDFAAYHEQYNV